MRRRLRMSWGEWTALPWYEQRALREGLHRERNPDEPVIEQKTSPEEEAALLASMGFDL